MALTKIGKELSQNHPDLWDAIISVLTYVETKSNLRDDVYGGIEPISSADYNRAIVECLLMGKSCLDGEIVTKSGVKKIAKNLVEEYENY